VLLNPLAKGRLFCRESDFMSGCRTRLVLLYPEGESVIMPLLSFWPPEISVSSMAGGALAFCYSARSDEKTERFHGRA